MSHDVIRQELPTWVMFQSSLITNRLMEAQGLVIMGRRPTKRALDGWGFFAIVQVCNEIPVSWSGAELGWAEKLRKTRPANGC